jgi:hypothetical protein
MGIIEDDLPYSLGEKSGMKKVLAYILPKDLSAPSHQTVQHDLDVLYDKLDDKVAGGHLVTVVNHALTDITWLPIS